MIKPKPTVYLIILATILTISAGILTFLLTYEKDIEKLVKKELANYIESPFEFEKISINIFKNFPRVSLAVRNLVVYEDVDFGSQKLVTARHLFFQMSIVSLLRKNYVIERIAIEKGSITIKTNDNKESNYLVFKESESRSEEFNLELQKIVISDFKISYLNDASKIYTTLTIDNSDLKGLFQNTVYSLESQSNISIDSFNYSTIKLLKNSDLKLDFILKIDNGLKQYSIKQFDAILDAILINLNGKISDEKEKGYNISLKVNTRGMQLSDIIPLLPDSFRHSDLLKLAGKCNFNAELNGYYSKKEHPAVKLNFDLSEGTAMLIKENIFFDQINLKGKYLSDNNGYLEISEAKIKQDNKQLNLKLKLSNFKNPYLDVSFQSDISPSALILLSNYNLIKDVEGNVSINVQVQGFIKEFVNNRFENSKLKLISDIRDLSFKFENREVKNLQGRIEATEEKINFTGLTGKFDKTNFKTTGIIADYFYYFDSNITNKVRLWANVEIDKVNVDDYMPEKSTSSTLSDNKKYLFPQKLKYEINMNASQIHYDNFNSTNIKASINYNGKEISFGKVNLTTAEGLLLASGKVYPQKDKFFQIDGIAQFSMMNIQQVFYQMNNFEQDFITDKHLRGKASGNLQFNMNISYDFEPDYNSVFCVADVLVEKGNIKDFQPLIDIFGFVKMKKLNDVYFDKLENTILIKEQVITIPYMNVINSAFNISLSGTHTFNDEINYLLKVNLTELLLKQQKIILGEEGYTESDNSGGMNVYLSMIGTVDDYKLKPASVKVKQNMKESEKVQKTNIQKMLKKSPVTPEKNENYEIEWDDN